MALNEASRRRLLQATVSLAALGTLAGCGESTDQQPTDTETEPPDGRIGNVPEGMAVAANVRVSSLLTDTDIQTTLDAWLSETPQGPSSVSATLDSFQDDTGLDPRELSEVLVFAGPELSRYGTVVWTDLSDDAVTAALAEQEFEEAGTYEGKPVYAASEGNGETSWVAVLDEGVFAAGLKSVVEDVVDVHVGNGEAVGGTVEDMYTSAQTGYLRTGFEVPETVADAASGQSWEVLESVSGGRGSVRESGDEVGFEFVLETDTADAADDIASLIDGSLTTAEQSLDGEQRDAAPYEEIRPVLDSTDVEQSGSTVTVTNDYGIETLLLVVAVVASFVLGLGGSTDPTPTMNFTFDYDSRADTLRISHYGGDTVASSDIYVRGTGFKPVNGVDQTQPERWQGSASGQKGSEPAILSGDTVTVGVESDYEIRVVYESDETTATLAEDRGPDA